MRKFCETKVSRWLNAKWNPYFDQELQIRSTTSQVHATRYTSVLTWPSDSRPVYHLPLGYIHMGGDIQVLGPMGRSARSCTSWHELVTWSTESVNSRSESRIWISFRIYYEQTLVPHFYSFRGFSKVWILHTFTTWKRCEMATVSSVIFAGAHKYLRSFRMSMQYPRNICDVWKKNQSIPIIPRWPLITSAHTYPRVDLTLRTDWCVRLPCIIVDPRNYFRSFSMCIYHLLNVCDVWKNSVHSHHTSPIPTSISTYPRVDLALRTD